MILSIPLWSDFIKFRKTNRIHTYIPFNPTMVWFYHTTVVSEFVRIFVLSIPLWSDFIADVGEVGVWLPFVFQSHYGLILSSTIFELLNSLYPFNPTMVWFYLEDITWGTIDDIDNDFQSHYGLILSIEQAKKAIADMPTFNPTMVWFYPLLYPVKE